MAETRVVFYRESNWAPVLEWMAELRTRDRKAYANGLARLKLLKEQGFKLGRPAAAPLEKGLYELRWKHVHVQYRILYFFHGQSFVVLAHAIVKKEQEVPKDDLRRAFERKQQYEQAPSIHTLEKEIEDA